MKLLYELPIRIREKYSDVLVGKRILYCVPCDLTEDGLFNDGWMVVVDRYILRFTDT